MAKLQSINWPQDVLVSSALTVALLDAVEILTEFVPADRIKEASEALDRRMDEVVAAQEKSSLHVQGTEIARGALHQIVRR